MDFGTVRKTLEKTNLYFDTETLIEISYFLEHYIGALIESDLEYHVFASAAIVNECQLFKSLNSSIMVNGKLRTENIMRNLPQ